MCKPSRCYGQHYTGLQYHAPTSTPVHLPYVRDIRLAIAQLDGAASDPILDDQNPSSIGDVIISPSSPNTV